MFEHEGINQARTGASGMARRGRKNPTEIMVNLIEADPTAAFDRIFKQWWEIVKADDDYHEAIGFHAGTNIWASLTRNKPPQRRPGMKEIAERQAQIEAVASKVANKVLTLNFVMPNGHKLGECTGTEVVKFGGVFTAIGKKAGKQLVGKVFTSDKQIQAIK